MSIVSIWPLLSATTARAGEKAAQEGLAVNAVPWTKLFFQQCSTFG